MAKKTRYEKYVDALESALWGTPYEGTIRAVENTDGSIDAELLIPVPRGVDAEEIVDSFEDSFTMPRDAWLTVGVRLEPTGVARVAKDRYAEYNRFGGMVDISIHPGKLSRKGDVFERARSDVIEGLRAKRHNKPKEVLVRLHYRSKGRKPRRKGE